MRSLRLLIRTGYILVLGAALLLSLAVPALAQGASDRAPGRTGATPAGPDRGAAHADQTPGSTAGPSTPTPRGSSEAPGSDEQSTTAERGRSGVTTSDPEVPVAARDQDPTSRRRDTAGDTAGGTGSDARRDSGSAADDEASSGRGAASRPPAASPRQGSAPTPSNDAGSGTTTHDWDGRGRSSQQCGKAGDGPRNAEAGWIHWVFSTAGSATGAELALTGSGSGSYQPAPSSAAVWHFFTPYFEVSTLQARLTYTGSAGAGGGLVISDYCPGSINAEEPGDELGDDRSEDRSQDRTDDRSEDLEDDRVGDGSDGLVEELADDLAEEHQVGTDEIDSDDASGDDVDGQTGDSDEETEVLGVQEEIDVEVLDVVVEASDDAAPAAGDEVQVLNVGAALAYTGLSALFIIAIGLGLTLGGGGLLLRRRPGASG